MTTVEMIDKEKVIAQLFGRVHFFTWRADAGADLVRDLARESAESPDSQYCLQKVQCVCDALLMSTSVLMEDISTLCEMLEVEYIDWDEVSGNIPDISEMRRVMGLDRC